MKVAELIKKLQELDPDLEVYEAYDSMYNPVKKGPKVVTIGYNESWGQWTDTSYWKDLKDQREVVIIR